MKPPPFAYDAPETVDEALSLLAEHGDDAKVLAGGQSLIPLLSMRLARPARLVDIGRIAELGRFHVNGRDEHRDDRPPVHGRAFERAGCGAAVAGHGDPADRPRAHPQPRHDRGQRGPCGPRGRAALR